MTAPRYSVSTVTNSYVPDMKGLYQELLVVNNTNEVICVLGVASGEKDIVELEPRKDHRYAAHALGVSIYFRESGGIAVYLDQVCT
jgi:hypothetical protein